MSKNKHAHTEKTQKAKREKTTKHEERATTKVTWVSEVETGWEKRWRRLPRTVCCPQKRWYPPESVAPALQA